LLTNDNEHNSIRSVYFYGHCKKSDQAIRPASGIGICEKHAVTVDWMLPARINKPSSGHSCLVRCRRHTFVFELNI